MLNAPQGPPAHNRTQPTANGQRPLATSESIRCSWRASAVTQLAVAVPAEVDASQGEVRNKTLVDPWGSGFWGLGPQAD